MLPVSGRPGNGASPKGVRLLSIIICALLCVAVAPPAGADTSGDLNAARDEVARLERESGRLAAAYAEEQTTLGRLDREVRGSEAHLAELRAEVEKKQGVLSARAREFYKQGPSRSMAGLSALLSLEKLQEYDRALKYISDVQGDTHHALDQYNAARSDLDIEVSQLKAKKVHQEQLLSELEAKKEQIEAAGDRQAELVGKYEKQLASERTAVRASPGGRGRGVPGDIASYGNGRLPASALTSVGIGDHQLWAPAAAAFKALFAAAAGAGVNIGISDSYRSYAAQVDVARRKGLYSRGGLAARPGTSNHGWGLSLDLQLSAAAQSWMRGNARSYGFYEDVPRESWHWTYYGA